MLTRAVFSEGTAARPTTASQPPGLSLRVLGIGKHVDDLDRPAFQRSSPDERLSPRGKLPDEHELFDSLVFLLGMAVARRPTVDLAVAPEQPHVVRVAKPGRRLRKHIEHCCKSKVERLITLSTSAVAACCSSASASLRLRAARFSFSRPGARVWRCAERRGGAEAKVLALRRLAIAMPHQVLVRIRTWKLSKDISATCHHR
jgi:hypothetical protein